MSDDVLTGDQVRDLEGLDDWRTMYGALEARFETGDFATGLALVDRIGAAAEAANHHPDLTLTYGAVRVVLTSHDAGGRTHRDVELAREISAIAADLGVTSRPQRVQRLELALDTWALDEVKPFWQAVLALEDTGPDELADAHGDTPTIWFQEAAPTTAQRWHLDLRVPPEIAEERISAAVAAGGRIVSSEAAPRFTVLADAQGNQVCICTDVGRGG